MVTFGLSLNSEFFALWPIRVTYVLVEQDDADPILLNDGKASPLGPPTLSLNRLCSSRSKMLIAQVVMPIAFSFTPGSSAFDSI